MIHAHNSKAKVLTRVHLREATMDLEKEIRQYLVNYLKRTNAYVALTIDHWTSIGKQNFTGKHYSVLFELYFYSKLTQLLLIIIQE